MKCDLASFQQKLKNLFPNDNIEILEFNGAFQPIKYKCLTCNTIYEKTRANHLYENHSLCQHCVSTRDSKIRNWIIKFLRNNSQFKLAEAWSGNTADNLSLKCNKCGTVFSKQPANLYLRTTNTICPHCGKNGAPITFDQFQKRLTETQKKDYVFLNYIDISKSCTIRHSCGFVYSQKPLNFLLSCGCPKCFKKRSRGEKTILAFLEAHAIQFFTQYRFEDFNHYPYDFYLPDYNLLIEYNGAQHYRPVSYWGGEQTFAAQQQRDEKKRDYAQKHNIKLLTIPYTEFDNLSVILESATTKEETRNARDDIV